MMSKVAMGKIKTRGLRQQVSREQRKRTYIFFAGIAIALAYLSYNLLFGEMGVIKYIELKQNKKRLESEITRIDKENKALNVQVNSLKKDPYYIEKYAREEYGLAKPDEFIFQFKNDDK
jgi:cell division protein FtsB